jgi:hypothetical protein
MFPTSTPFSLDPTAVALANHNFIGSANLLLDGLAVGMVLIIVIMILFRRAIGHAFNLIFGRK